MRELPKITAADGLKVESHFLALFTFVGHRNVYNRNFDAFQGFFKNLLELRVKRDVRSARIHNRTCCYELFPSLRNPPQISSNNTDPWCSG